MKTLSLFNPTFGSDVFDRLDQELGLFAPVSSACFTTPRVDVRETNEAYIMDMDLPGMTEKDINLNLQDRVLTIAYVKEAEKEDEKKKGAEGTTWLIRERRNTSFNRRFTLPEDIDASKVDASFTNGVLSINIPRRPETQPRQITIRTN